MVNITEDGEYELNANGHISTVVYVTGDLGGGTATIGYLDSASAFVAFSAGAAIAGEQYKVEHGDDVRLAIKLISSTAADMDVETRSLAR